MKPMKPKGSDPNAVKKLAIVNHSVAQVSRNFSLVTGSRCPN
jgi:hypothetical protein